MIDSAAFLVMLGWAVQGGAPDPEEIAKAGKATMEKLSTSAAGWTTVITLQDGQEVKARCVMNSPERRRMSFSGFNVDLGTLIIRDGIWHSIENGKAAKYRPFEAPFLLPSMYLFLAHVDPRVITEGEVLKPAQFESMEAGIARYRFPIAEASRRLMETLLGSVKDVKTKDPELRKQLEEQARRLRDFLAKGLPVHIEAATGLIVLSGTDKMQVQCRDFRLIEKVADREFSTEGREWADFTSDPTTGDRNELIMASHSAVWNPQMRSTGDVDVRLVDLKSGRSRRVPLEVPGGMGGCFTKDRMGVVLPGTDEDGRVSLYLVDLKTGENRELGATLFTHGWALFPVLSPDGAKVAAIHNSGDVGKQRLAVISLADGSAQYVGGPRDICFHSWLPDGSGFVLRRILPSEPDRPGDRVLGTLDMKGVWKDLRPGDTPILLADGKSILFEHGDKWMTCDLKGENPKVFGNGLAGHDQPTLSPDGRRLLFFRRRPGKEPHIVMFGLDGAEQRVVLREPGLWVYPVWR